MYETYEDTRKASVDAPLHLARCLGWFSVALGAVELLAPGRLARALGMEGREGLIQGYGIREIGTGLAILSAGNPRPWIWGRVAGDALDLATLAAAHNDENPRKKNVEVALAAVAGVTALDIVCGQQLGRPAPSSVEHYVADRSGLPRPPDQMRGAADDFVVPPDMRSPFDRPSAH